MGSFFSLISKTLRTAEKKVTLTLWPGLGLLLTKKKKKVTCIVTWVCCWKKSDLLPSSHPPPPPPPGLFLWKTKLTCLHLWFGFPFETNKWLACTVTWVPAVDRYVLGMYSFGLEETNLYEKAEKMARKVIITCAHLKSWNENDCPSTEHENNTAGPKTDVIFHCFWKFIVVL